MPENIDKIRKKNFRRVIEDNHGGDYEEVGSLIGRTEGTVKKYFSPSANRRISNPLARYIEKRLSLPPRYLDRDDEKETEIYFVMLIVQNNERYRVIQWLYENSPEVIDCSGILGQYDILLKVQVPSIFYLDKFFARLSRQPNIIQSQTFFSVNTLHFQKNQTELYSVENPRKIKNFMDFYKNNRLNDLATQMQDIERGKIVASNKSSHRISLLEIIKRSRDTFDSIREYGEIIEQYREYLSEESKKIKEGFISRRIFLLPKDLIHNEERREEKKQFYENAKQVSDMGGQVRFLYTENWLVRSETLEAECFAVVDREFIYVNKRQTNKAVLHENAEYIEMYQNIFDRNWDISTPYDSERHKV